jgi:dTDP-4-dehydrorhamnose 3,5-epimerase
MTAEGATVTTTIIPKKEEQSVTPEGVSTAPLIDGVIIQRIPPHEDDRGEVVEVWNQAWFGFDDPVVHVYKVVTRPGKTRGWQKHIMQDDRLFVSRGRLRFGLYDDREGSPTYGMLNVFTLSDHQRAMVRIPHGVWHGIQNVGEDDGEFVNFPTHRYIYHDPDKYRLPLKNDLIPFDFSDDDGH